MNPLSEILPGLSGKHPDDELNEFIAEVVAECEWDPFGFASQMYPWGIAGTQLADKMLRTWQGEVLSKLRDAIAEGHDKILIDIASGHGIGKSSLISMLVHWAMTCHHARGYITANTKTQLETKTMPEIANWNSIFFASHWLEENALSIRRKDGDKDHRIDAIPWSENNPDAFGGLHNAKGIVLVVFDEASGIAKVIWDTVTGAMSDADNLIIWVRFGNPLRNTGQFAETFRTEPPRVGATIRMNIDSRDVEGTDTEFINEMIRLNGGEDSDYAKSRWRGIFPDQSDWQLISGATVDGAQSRLRPIRSDMLDPIIAGIDFARGGADKTCLRFRRGYDGRSFPTYEWPKAVGGDSMNMAAILSQKLHEHKPHYIMADGGGIGGPIIDRLRKLGHDVLEVKPGGAAQDAERYRNKRAEIWCRFRDWMDEGGTLPCGEQIMRAEIVQQEFFFTKDKDLITLVPKEDLRSEGLKSPDHAEAFIQTFGFTVPSLNQPSKGKESPQSARDDYDPFSRL